MGVNLGRRALTYVTPQLHSDRARVVLLSMCMRALDNDEHPEYRAGSGNLARELGYDLDDPSGKRAVARAIQELRRGGWISQSAGRPRSWKRAWLLHIPGLGEGSRGPPTNKGNPAQSQSQPTQKKRDAT